MTKTFCDKCEKLISNYDSSTRLEYYNSKRVFLTLCKECWTPILKAIKE